MPEQRPGKRPSAHQLAVDGGRGRHGDGVPIMRHQLSQPVDADVGPGHVAGHCDLECLDRPRRFTTNLPFQARYSRLLPFLRSRPDLPSSGNGIIGTFHRMRVGLLAKSAARGIPGLHERLGGDVGAEDLLLVGLVDGGEQEPVAGAGAVLAGLPVQLDHMRERPDRRQAITQLLQLAGKISR
jgi:hypothetical protein